MDEKQAAKAVCKRLRSHGHEAVFAGGCVRDMLLGVMPHDYDIATSAVPDEVLDIFPKAKPVGKAFGVVLIRHGGHELEVATFRRDGVYKDGRRPDTVKFTSMEEDAKRRDFTINAMFFDPETNRVIDFVGGKKDLENKIVTFVGDAWSRITEDNLRMLRFCRFAAKLKGNIKLSDVINIRANSHKLPTIPAERIREEFMKMLKLGVPRGVIEILMKTHIIEYFLPEVLDLSGCEQSPDHHPEGDVLEHTLQVIEFLKDEDPLLQLAALLHDIGKPATFKREADGRITNKGHEKVGAEMANVIMHRLKFSNDEVKHVVALIRDHMKVHVAKDMKKSTLKKLLAKSHADDLIKLGRADVFGRKDDEGWTILEDAKNMLAPEEVKPAPLLTGRDLIAMGFVPGPKFKSMLSDLQDAQLDERISTKEEAIEFIKTGWPI